MNVYKTECPPSKIFLKETWGYLLFLFFLYTHFHHHTNNHSPKACNHQSHKQEYLLLKGACSLYHFRSLAVNIEVKVICNHIKAGRLKPSLRTHIAHVKHVKTIVAAKQKQNESSCLKCGKPMVLRTARSGVNQGKQFLDCTGYPACRAIKEVL